MKHTTKFHIGRQALAVLLLAVMAFSAFSSMLGTTGAEEAPGSGEGDPPLICELKIRYVTATYNEEQTILTYVDIYPSYHVKLPYGYEYSEISPEVNSYTLSDDDYAVVEGVLKEEYKEILVVYRESVGTAKYTVNYWTQNVDGSDLTKLDELCYEGEGEVGTTVTVALPSVPGYSWSNDDLLVYITADGHAVKNVYYVKSEKRKLVFRTGTGYAKVVEAYPGEDITAERAAIRDVDPEKPGYKFVNWDTSIASLGEQTLYNADGTVQKTYSCYVSAAESGDGKDHYYMPADDYVINAIWAKAATPYRVVFWFEKADGTGYTNGGIDETRYALTDTEVTAAYYDKLIVDEKTLFNTDFTKIINITTDDAGNPYNFVEHYSEPAKDAEGNVLNDANGNPVVIEYTNTYDNPQGKTYAEYKTMHFFGFDYDHCNNATVTADGTATLNVYYKRETWTVRVYKMPSNTDGNETWRTIEGRYGSVVPAVGAGEADDMNKLPTYDVAKAYYNTNKPDGTKDFRELRTQSNDKGTLFNLGTQQVFTTEGSNGTHVYSVYPYYDNDATAKSRRVFYGANLGVTIDNTPNLDADYVNFATSSSYLFKGTIQSSFIFDESRTRAWTWEGAMFRYQACEVGTEITEGGWSDWKYVDTTTKPDDISKITVEEGQAKIVLLQDGSAYWKSYAYSPAKDFYLQVILPRKKLDLNFVSHNAVLKTEKVECGAPLADYYTYKPADTATERFAGWYEDAELTQPVNPSAVMGYEDDNIYAKWVPKQCKVTFDARNGSDVAEEIYDVGTVLAKPAEDPVKEGFRFVGWYTEEGAHYLFLGELGGDLALHAVWEPIDMVEYVVRHILKHKNGTEELILEVTDYDSKHKTVTVSALTNENKPAYLFKNLYVVHDGTNPATQTINLNSATLAERTATFYYNEMTEWGYTITYLDIDDETTKIQDNYSAETDLLSLVVSAPTITVGEKTWVPVRSVGHRLSPALAGAMLTPGGKNLITIYYDEQHTLTFDLQGGTSDALYNARHLIKAETTTVPAAPTYAGHIFLGWDVTDEYGTVTTYYPDDVYTMPDKNVTFVAQWADAVVIDAPGRLLDRLSADAHADIADNGAVTALFSLIRADSENRIKPNDLKIYSEDKLPAGTSITLIVYPAAEGQVGASYYYRKLTEESLYVPLTDFTRMGGGSSDKFSAANVSAFRCQICIRYPDSNVSENAAVSLSTSKLYPEPATRVNITFKGTKILPPAGTVTAAPNTSSPGSFNSTVTVSGIANLISDQSDSRHTHSVLADRESVIAVTLVDNSGATVPFPEDCVLSVNGIAVKSSGTVVGIISFNASEGDYNVTATGLPIREPLSLSFAVCAADDASEAQKGHPLLLECGSVTVPLAYEEAVEYAVRAELTGGEIERVFTVPSEDKTLLFDVLYRPAESTQPLSVAVRFKGASNYNEQLAWQTEITAYGGTASVAVTVPAGSEPGTYRIVFTIADAEYDYNIIITDG